VQEEGFLTIVPEQHAVLESVALANQKYLLLTYLYNVQNKVFIAPLESLENSLISSFNENGSIKSSVKTVGSASRTDNEWIGFQDAEQIALPVGCSVSNKTCRRDDPRIFIHCAGFTLAGRVYKYRFHKDESLEQSESGDDTSTESKPKSFGELFIWRESFVDGFVPDQWTVEQV